MVNELSSDTIKYFNDGIDFSKRGNYLAALASFDKALAIEPNDANVWYNRGLALRKLDKYSEAVDSYDKAIVINPNDTDAWYHRGIALLELGRITKSAGSYDEAVDLGPNEARLWCATWCVAPRDHVQYSEALASFDKVIAINPNDPEVWTPRGLVLFGLHQYTESVASFDKAIAINPNDAEALYYRGIALHKFDEPDKLDGSEKTPPPEFSGYCKTCRRPFFTKKNRVFCSDKCMRKYYSNKSVIKPELIDKKTTGSTCCEILTSHAEILREDPQRLSTGFIKNISKCDCKEENTDEKP